MCAAAPPQQPSLRTPPTPPLAVLAVRPLLVHLLVLLLDHRQQLLLLVQEALLLHLLLLDHLQQDLVVQPLHAAGVWGDTPSEPAPAEARMPGAAGPSQDALGHAVPCWPRRRRGRGAARAVAGTAWGSDPGGTVSPGPGGELE